jgi:hypothetical protein
MNTPHTVFQNPRVILRMLTVVSIAVALIGVNEHSNHVGAVAINSEFALLETTDPLMLAGTLQVVNSGAGDPSDPHVDCNLASYTSEELRRAECQAQSGKKLTADQAAQFINSANQIKTELDCQ